MEKKKGLGQGSNDITASHQAQDPKFKPQYHKKRKRERERERKRKGKEARECSSAVRAVAELARGPGFHLQH
jgi:hypothetical protein